MSMDVMGIREEELIDGVELAGVASFLARRNSRIPTCLFNQIRPAQEMHRPIFMMRLFQIR